MVALLLAGSFGCVKRTNLLTIEQQHNREQLLQRLLSVGVDALRAGSEADLLIASDAFSFAAELAPTDRRVLDGLGVLAWRRCKLAEAKRLFQRAISSDPEYSRPYAHLAIIAEAEGDIRAALELLRIALERNPLNYPARKHRELLLSKINERSFANRSGRQVERCRQWDLDGSVTGEESGGGGSE